MTAYFIAGTGTGVGKTFSTCALLYAAKHQGKNAKALKPVISGWQPDGVSDTSEIIAASGGTQSLSDTTLHRFAAPLSPHQAAAREGKEINSASLIEWSQAQRLDGGLTLIEGVGGVMVPLTHHFTTLDWMDALQLPVILVVGSYLGTISHSLTALAALRARHLRVAALIMNETDGSTVTVEEAFAGLAPFIADIPLRILQPRVSSWKEATAIQAMEL